MADPGGLPDPALRVKLVHGLVDFPLDHQLRGLGGPLCRFFHGLLFLLGESGWELLGLWLAELSEPDGSAGEELVPLFEDLSPDWLESLEDELEFLSFLPSESAFELLESFSDLEEESLSLEAFELEFLDGEAEEPSCPFS